MYFVCVCPSWLIHTARDRDMDREMMGFYITLCTVHTTQGQGTIAFYCARPGPCPCPGPVQCVWAMTLSISRFFLPYVQAQAPVGFPSNPYDV